MEIWSAIGWLFVWTSNNIAIKPECQIELLLQIISWLKWPNDYWSILCFVGKMAMDQP